MSRLRGYCEVPGDVGLVYARGVAVTKKCYHVGLLVPSKDFESWNQIVMLCGKTLHKDEDTWDPPK